MKRTVLYETHLAAGARMVEFGGWEMPLQYPTGIVEEHLRTRKEAGLFDVSHMGRFQVRGPAALPFLQHTSSNNAAALDAGQAQYTMIPSATGGALDDAYLYRLTEEEYLLVVNAANREKDWGHLTARARDFPGAELADRTEELAMLSLQGPLSRQILAPLLERGCLPEPERNALCRASLAGHRVTVSRTGYTGEALGFELFVPRDGAVAVWNALTAAGAVASGLGARDTLRLEAGLPLYGHELGTDPEGKEIPIFACPLARFAVSFSPLKGAYLGREALYRQYQVYRRILRGDFSDTGDLPRVVRPVALLERGVARQGSEVYRGAGRIGWVTSGTVVPYWVVEGEGLPSRLSDRSEKRPLCLALLDAQVEELEPLQIEVRERKLAGLVVPYFLRAEVPPYTRPILFAPEQEAPRRRAPASVAEAASSVQAVVGQAVENHLWRQRRCINLIPSEMTLSPLARLASVTDPAFRYAEHRKMKALGGAEVFYYQGTGFIARVEELLAAELAAYLGCRQVETRLISGQMANTAVFSALIDHLNREDRRSEPQRLRCVMNHHILRGGHLSAQPMGALRDYVARDPRTERPAVVGFPARQEDPYRVDLEATAELLERHRPQLLILGRSVILYREPVAEVRRMVSELGLKATVMFDMAHVLGLAGPHYQQPFAEGADVVTASTHKTFFGTQRGIVAADLDPDSREYLFWEAVERRTFPGSVSNHHLGTMLGLLVATYEMRAFRDAYQRQVVRNAKAFARALAETGLRVAGDPELSHTETHQVVVEVGYGKGVEAARRLEESNIIVNYQAIPGEEGFSAAGGLRLGVAEMTRFGMEEGDFQILAQLIHDVVVEGRAVADQVAKLREAFQTMRYSFDQGQVREALEALRELL